MPANCRARRYRAVWPDNVFVLERRARTFRKIEAYDKALADLFKAVSIAPNDPDLLRDLNYTLRDVDRTEDALAAIEKAFVYGEHDVTIWDACFGEFIAGVPAPLAIGTVELEDGTRVKGFVCEAYAADGARDISELGSWRAYLAAR